jgi:hypothetical protein
MPRKSYRDLAQFGVPFVTPDQPEFAALAEDIRKRPLPFGPELSHDLSTAAVLVNQTGRSIIALAWIWDYRAADGQSRTSRFSNLGSSMQMDILTGRITVHPNRFSFILPASKRLITEDAMFGDNSDVLPPDLPECGGGGWSGSARRGAYATGAEIVAIELRLDTVFLEDGLCIGPDEGRLFQSLIADLDKQRSTAQQIVDELHNGASVGRVFEILRPLAHHPSPEPGTHERDGPPLKLLAMFANQSINFLVNTSDQEILAWFERAAQPSTLTLRRLE